MALLSSGDGISCDLCGRHTRGDFIYYSIDCHKELVDGRRRNRASSPVLSLDACQVCMSKIHDAVRINYEPTIDGVNCDLCNAKLRGVFEFYYCVVAQVTVRMSDAVLCCAGCGRATTGHGPACQCGSQSIGQLARVVVDKEYLQLAICGIDFNAIAGLAERHKLVG